jgi:hypothetical protein
MLITFVRDFIEAIVFPAVVVSAGILILACERAVFEVDTKPFEQTDPATGVTTRNWQWKYMSDQAQNARFDLLFVIKFLRFTAITMIVVSVVLFVASGIIGVLGWAGFDQLQDWWQNNPYIDFIFAHGLGILFLAIAPFIIYYLARVVSNVVLARSLPSANKSSGWTPY